MKKVKYLLIILLFFSYYRVNALEKLYDKLLDNAVYDDVESEYVKGNGIDFSLPSSNISSEDININGLGLYIYSSSKGSTYPIVYYRGNIDNNYVILGDFCFQIVRTTDTGGIKIMYAGLHDNYNCNNSLDDLHIGKVSYGISNSKTYLQYAYLDEDGNVVDSVIKEKVDEWFSQNMLDYLDYIEDSPFCNDLSSGVINAYLIRDELYSGDNPPRLSCPKEYSYTVESSKGNGLLKYPVGIINAADLTLAGGKLKTVTPELQENVPYIFIKVSYWSMSPYAPNKLMYPNTKNSINDNVITYQAGARPYFSIQNATYITMGDGTRDNPYLVSFEDELDNSSNPVVPHTDINYSDKKNNIFYLLLIALLGFVVLKRRVNYDK